MDNTIVAAILGIANLIVIGFFAWLTTRTAAQTKLTADAALATIAKADADRQERAIAAAAPGKEADRLTAERLLISQERTRQIERLDAQVTTLQAQVSAHQQLIATVQSDLQKANDHCVKQIAALEQTITTLIAARDAKAATP